MGTVPPLDRGLSAEDHARQAPHRWRAVGPQPGRSKIRRGHLGKGESPMMRSRQRRSRSWAVMGALAAALVLAGVWSATAQSPKPIKIGFGMALTGGLAGNGKAALLAMQIWRDDVNKKGGLLGRPVELIYYDDQTNPATVPGIYTKLLDVDKVDLIIGAYGMQRKKVLIGLLGNAV